MELYNINSVYSLIETLYGVEADSENFEDLALNAWELIGNKHTRLYRYTADTENKELRLPCNVVAIESVTCPLVDAQVTSNKSDYLDTDAVLVEKYIDAWGRMDDPLYQKGKFVKYREGGDRLYFTRDYKDLTIIYHGIIADEEGLPMINDKEARAIATFIAYVETYKDGLKKKDKNTLALAQDLYMKWLRSCNQARSVALLSQNDMDAILDVKYRWDRKNYGKSMKPVL